MDSVVTKEVGARIAARRKSLGLTQEDLADKVSVRAATVSRWERGDFLPPVADFVGLARALGASVDWLTTGRGDEQQTSEPADNAA